MSHQLSALVIFCALIFAGAIGYLTGRMDGRRSELRRVLRKMNEKREP